MESIACESVVIAVISHRIGSPDLRIEFRGVHDLEQVVRVESSPCVVFCSPRAGVPLLEQVTGLPRIAGFVALLWSCCRLASSPNVMTGTLC
jgi:hypothetical protein